MAVDAIGIAGHRPDTADAVQMKIERQQELDGAAAASVATHRCYLAIGFGNGGLSLRRRWFR